MVVTVGGSTKPIERSIFEHRPEFVSFFASQDTCDLIAQIKSSLEAQGVSIKSEVTLADDVNDLLHCHEKAEEAVQRVMRRGYERDNVIVDYTGGTKNMSVALALAAITHGVSFSYVGGSERTKSGVGVVVDGHEIVYKSINPWDFLAVEEKKKIALLFNQYQFKAANDLIDGLLEKSSKYKSLFRKISFLIDGYQNWDLFRHKDAQKAFDRAKIEEIMESDDSSLKAFARATQERLPFLNEIIARAKKPSVFSILDMFSNAERRFEEGKVDDAVLRLYRLVEMVAQEKLMNSYAIDVSNARKDQIPESLRDEFVKNHTGAHDNKIKLPMTAAFRLLGELGDETGKIFTAGEGRFRDIQSSRNHSYLAHGFESSKETTYIKLRDFILDLKIFSSADAPTFPKIGQ